MEIKPLINGFWGKLQRDDQGTTCAWLPLVDHCIDVACVFRALCDLSAIARALEKAAGQPLAPEQLDRLAVLALLHDIGKCNHGFQAKADPKSKFTAGHTSEVGHLLAPGPWQEKLCAVLPVQELTDWFQPADSVIHFLIAAISHHGRPAQFDGLSATLAAKLWQPNAERDPFVGIAELVAAARKLFPAAFDSQVPTIQDNPALQHRFAGLVMLADWLGSHAELFFPYEPEEKDRITFSRAAARRAVMAVGLDVETARSRLGGGLPEYRSVFGFEPYSLQHRLYDSKLPKLLIAESETGSGKTEAAIGHFLALFAAGEVDSLYFALPTRVAARELYERVLKYMREFFGEACPPVVLAAPGYAKVDGDEPERSPILPPESHRWHDDEIIRAHERAWAAERPKRFLAAPIAVGTIDQALLSAMKVAHAHLRSVCLDRALLVVDEVHASDIYMRVLLRHLLDHHRQVGGHALLLSATLGAAARAEFVTAKNRHVEWPNYQEAVDTPYPALSGAGWPPEHLTDDSARRKSVTLAPLPALIDPIPTLQPLLREAVADGKRVLVVLNTVARAIGFTRAVENDPVLVTALFSCKGVLCPHHGRFARADREWLDAEVTRRLGKHSPDGAILLIGTQTLEQSLDIDADWLITDLCPMDVLLQRIGRLHRHDRGSRSAAVCTILVPEQATFEDWIDRRNGHVRGIAGLGAVYLDLGIVQLTRDQIGDGCDIEIPQDNRKLVEATTHPERLATLTGAVWDKHRQYIESIAISHGQIADMALLREVPFGTEECRFTSDQNERLTTRLGLEDRRVPLGSFYPSPFGSRLDELSIPGHLAPKTEAVAPEAVEVSEQGIRLQYGGRHYLYSRYGLELCKEGTPNKVDHFNDKG